VIKQRDWGKARREGGGVENRPNVGKKLRAHPNCGKWQYGLYTSCIKVSRTTTKASRRLTGGQGRREGQPKVGKKGIG